jgi:DNA-binding transcriptional MerR regulator
VLTISEVADFAGVTVRAVRHYHQRGLLAEPPRDASGYRRYDADAVVALVRIRTLAEAGVPLARVAELLEADEEKFAQALVDLDADLRAQQRRIAEHRAQVRLLAGGDSLALPQVVVDYLDRLRGLGLSEYVVKLERDSWILVHARHPDKVAEWMGFKNEQLDRPSLQRMYVMFDRSREWSPDDPRLEEVADAAVALFQEVSAENPQAAADDADMDEGVVDLLDDKMIESSPAWRRVLELIEERGWTGWSDVRQTGS